MSRREGFSFYCVSILSLSFFSFVVEKLVLAYLLPFVYCAVLYCVLKQLEGGREDP